jgi:putative sterol carrier protein
MSSAAEYFGNIAKNVAAAPEKATSLNALFKFDLTGDAASTYFVDLRKGTEKNFVATESTDEPNVTISMTADDFVGIFAGKVNPMQAFMGGKIKVKGDMGLAMKLQNIISMGKA